MVLGLGGFMVFFGGLRLEREIVTSEGGLFKCGVLC